MDSIPPQNTQIPGHQQISTAGALAYGCDEALNGKVFVQWKVTYHDVPPPPPCHQLEADTVGDIMMVVFYRESRRVYLERFHTTLMPDQHSGCNHAVPDQPQHLDPTGDLHLF